MPPKQRQSQEPLRRLPAPGGTFEWEGQQIEVPTHWPSSWLPSNLRVSNHLNEIIKEVLGPSPVYIKTAKNKGRYLKLSRGDVGLADEGKLIMLEVMAKVQKLRTTNAVAHEEILERSPWCTPHHPDWVGHLHQKVLKVIQGLRAGAADVQEGEEEAVAAGEDAAAAGPSTRRPSGGGAGQAATQANKEPRSSGVQAKVDSAAAIMNARATSGCRDRSRPAGATKGNAGKGTADGVTPSPTKAKVGRPRKHPAPDGAAAAAMDGAASVKQEHMDVDDGTTPAVGPGGLYQAAGIALVGPDLPAQRAPAARVASPPSRQLTSPSRLRNVSHADSPLRIIPSTTARGPSSGGRSPEPPELPPLAARGDVEEAPAVAEGPVEYFEFDGQSVPMPREWPKSWKASQGHSCKLLTVLMRDVLGPSPQVVWRPGQPNSRYLKNSYYGQGLADEGKLIMLEIMAGVLKLKKICRSQYDQIMEKIPWLTPDNRDWVALLWKKTHKLIRHLNETQRPGKKRRGEQAEGDAVMSDADGDIMALMAGGGADTDDAPLGTRTPSGAGNAAKKAAAKGKSSGGSGAGPSSGKAGAAGAGDEAGDGNAAAAAVNMPDKQKWRPPMPAVPPPPKLPLPAGGQYYEFDGEKVKVPLQWPTQYKQEKTLMARALTAVINEVLGPYPTNVRRKTLDNRYLREIGSAPDAGLAEVGKETMLRIMARIQKFKRTKDPRHAQIIERAPWLTTEDPDWVAYLWAKVSSFLNNYGQSKTVPKKPSGAAGPSASAAAPAPKKAAGSAKSKKKASGGAGPSKAASVASASEDDATITDSDHDTPAASPSPAKKRRTSHSPVQYSPGAIGTAPGAAERLANYTRAVMLAARRVAAHLPPTYVWSSSSSSEPDSSSESEPELPSSEPEPAVLAVALPQKRPALKVGLIPAADTGASGSRPKRPCNAITAAATQLLRTMSASQSNGNHTGSPGEANGAAGDLSGGQVVQGDASQSGAGSGMDAEPSPSDQVPLGVTHTAAGDAPAAAAWWGSAAATGAPDTSHWGRQASEAGAGATDMQASAAGWWQYPAAGAGMHPIADGWWGQPAAMQGGWDMMAHQQAMPAAPLPAWPPVAVQQQPAMFTPPAAAVNLPDTPSLAQLLDLPRCQAAADIALRRAAGLLQRMPLSGVGPGWQLVQYNARLLDVLQSYSGQHLAHWLFQVVRTFLMSCSVACRAEPWSHRHAGVFAELQERLRQLQDATDQLDIGFQPPAVGAGGVAGPAGGDQGDAGVAAQLPATPPTDVSDQTVAGEDRLGSSGGAEDSVADAEGRQGQAPSEADAPAAIPSRVTEGEAQPAVPCARAHNTDAAGNAAQVVAVQPAGQLRTAGADTEADGVGSDQAEEAAAAAMATDPRQAPAQGTDAACDVCTGPSGPCEASTLAAFGTAGTAAAAGTGAAGSCDGLAPAGDGPSQPLGRAQGQRDAPTDAPTAETVAQALDKDAPPARQEPQADAARQALAQGNAEAPPSPAHDPEPAAPSRPPTATEQSQAVETAISCLLRCVLESEGITCTDMPQPVYACPPVLRFPQVLLALGLHQSAGGMQDL